MVKKVKLVGACLLVVCLFSLCTARFTEAAPPTPGEILIKLEIKLDKVVSKADKRLENISDRIAKAIRKFEKGKISEKKFTKKLAKLERKAGNIRANTANKISDLKLQMTKKLNAIGADHSFIKDAQGKETAALNDKEKVYDTFDKEVDDAKDKIVSPSA